MTDTSTFPSAFTIHREALARLERLRLDAAGVRRDLDTAQRAGWRNRPELVARAAAAERELAAINEAIVATEETIALTKDAAHPAACPYCGSHAVSSVQPDLNLRNMRLLDDGTAQIGDPVDGSDFPGPDMAFCHGCSSEFVMPEDLDIEYVCGSFSVEYPTPPGKDEPGFIGKKVRYVATDGAEHLVRIRFEAWDTLEAMIDNVLAKHQLVIRVKGEPFEVVRWDGSAGLLIVVRLDDDLRPIEETGLMPDDLVDFTIG